MNKITRKIWLHVFAYFFKEQRKLLIKFCFEKDSIFNLALFKFFNIDLKNKQNNDTMQTRLILKHIDDDIFETFYEIEFDTKES